jgi:hypothetical protein
VSFVQLPVVFALPCHDTDAQNTRFIRARCGIFAPIFDPPNAAVACGPPWPAHILRTGSGVRVPPRELRRSTCPNEFQSGLGGRPWLRYGLGTVGTVPSRCIVRRDVSIPPRVPLHREFLESLDPAKLSIAAFRPLRQKSEPGSR